MFTYPAILRLTVWPTMTDGLYRYRLLKLGKAPLDVVLAGNRLRRSARRRDRSVTFHDAYVPMAQWFDTEPLMQNPVRQSEMAGL